jgi:hypothetical protein
MENVVDDAALVSFRGCGMVVYPLAVDDELCGLSANREL